MKKWTALKVSRYTLPTDYTKLSPSERREVREQYIKEQKGLCFWCKQPLSKPSLYSTKPINKHLFPPHFFHHPVHLQHNHDTNMTEGAVHAWCNAVMWQYYKK